MIKPYTPEMDHAEALRLGVALESEGLALDERQSKRALFSLTGMITEAARLCGAIERLKDDFESVLRQRDSERASRRGGWNPGLRTVRTVGSRPVPGWCWLGYQDRVVDFAGESDPGGTGGQRGTLFV